MTIIHVTAVAMPTIKIDMTSNSGSTVFQATRSTETQAAIEGLVFLITTYGTQIGTRLSEVRKLVDYFKGTK